MEIDQFFLATKAVVRFNDKALILKESKQYSDGTNDGRYDFPGGRLNPGETHIDSLKREVFEETSLDIEIVRPLHVSDWYPQVRGQKWQIIGIFFECKTTTDQVVLSDDHSDFAWINTNDYKDYNIIPNLEPVFKILN